MAFVAGPQRVKTRNSERILVPRFVCLMNCVVVELLEVVIGEKFQIFC